MTDVFPLTDVKTHLKFKNLKETDRKIFDEEQVLSCKIYTFDSWQLTLAAVTTHFKFRSLKKGSDQMSNTIKTIKKI